MSTVLRGTSHHEKQLKFFVKRIAFTLLFCVGIGVCSYPEPQYAIQPPSNHQQNSNLAQNSIIIENLIQSHKTISE
ncbi:unnamed protein product [Didymodactylos carnosus]|uniref:Uncharacterized protein n=1 Tax=Didymodactylos carnosus TaxID=1234261 RepID=A0A8S2EUR8_9BILA|nr:unnamed protein product [Didymodactylos carnosus]CAF4070559.1 unnamed protein product [Didymodactylos carnosus]